MCTYSKDKHPVIRDSHSRRLSLSMLDIGGALGLILGLSVQSLVSTISKNIKRLEHKTSRQRFITALIKFYDRRIRNPKYKNGNFYEKYKHINRLILQKSKFKSISINSMKT